MLKLCILLSSGEITLVLKHPPMINPKAPFCEGNITFHEDDVDGVYDFVKFIDWSHVIAILQYPAEEQQKEGGKHG